jgi:hypothetical protein
VEEELSTIDEGQHQVQLLLRLEAELQRHDERIVDSSKDEALSKSMRDLVAIHDMGLADRFNCIYALRISLPSLEDFPETTLSDQTRELEGLDGQRLAGAGLECNTNLDFPLTASKLVPLIMRAKMVEVRGELDASEEDVVTHIVSKTIFTTFRLLGAEVALNGKLRLA